jgi:hypothetical protein
MSEPVKYGAVWNGINPLTGQPYKWGDKVYYDAPVAPQPIPKKAMIFHISLAFAQLMDLPLDKFASNVATQMVKNAAIFKDPPFPIANLDAAQKAFHQADADASNLGKLLTADKNAKKEIVIDLLRQLATYIEAIPGITPEQAMLSGFEVIIPTHHAAMTPDAPVILDLFNKGSGCLGVKLQGSAHARTYQLRVRDASGSLVYTKTFSSTRDIVLPDLTPGKVYTVDACAMGGGNLTSDYCPSVNCMCT